MPLDMEGANLQVHSGHPRRLHTSALLGKHEPSCRVLQRRSQRLLQGLIKLRTHYRNFGAGIHNGVSTLTTDNHRRSNSNSPEIGIRDFRNDMSLQRGLNRSRLQHGMPKPIGGHRVIQLNSELYFCPRPNGGRIFLSPLWGGGLLNGRFGRGRDVSLSRAGSHLGINTSIFNF